MVPVSYNLRSLAVRKTTTFATALGIALVVFVFAAVRMLGAGIERTLTSTGKPDIAVVVRKGSDAELSSTIDTVQVGLVLAAKEVARRPDGKPDGAGEVVAVVTMDKLGTDGGVSNMQIRGVSDDVYAFRPDVKIIEGRAARPGADEVVVGKAILGRFKNLSLGESFELRKNRPVKVVGVLEASGTSYESETWADADVVRTAFGREGTVQSIRARLSNPAQFDAFKRGVEGNRQLGLVVSREPDFYEAQSQGTSLFINAMGGTVAVFFAIGAMIGAMITMYSAVANRKREIGTLRALGFGKLSILFSFLFEAVLLALLGGGVGALASLALGAVRFSMVNFQSWSEMVFTFDPTLGIVLGSLAFGAGMGLVGGLFPAIRAARMPLVQALKD
jgi:putative ABC transport system permease protein